MGALANDAMQRSAALENEPPDDVSLSEDAAQRAKRLDALKEEPVKTTPTPEPRGKLESFGAGAGAAVGRGAMGVQQLLGKGLSFVGNAADIAALRQAGRWLEADALEGAARLQAQNAPYAAANPKTNLAGEITGFVASPVNRLVPAGGAATSIAGAALKGSIQGAALNALTSPVEEGKEFLPEKARQTAVGALGGAAGGAVGYAVGAALNKGLDALRGLGARFTAGSAQTATETALDAALGPGAAQKVAAERPELFAGLKAQVEDAVHSGKSIDPASVTRLARAQSLPVPVPMSKGEVTRDPMQFAIEHTLKGMKGVGEPLADVEVARNRALIENLNAFGAKRGADIVDGAKPVIDTLQAADKQASKAVGKAYDAFKAATGRELDVPLQGLAQDYAKVLNERGSAIPAEVRKAFENYGLLSGTAQKSMTISEAEGLIKNYINKNYDPSNRVAAGALDELRNAVQNAISTGAGASAEGTAAAGLARNARALAAQRFNLIDRTPALKAAIQDKNPDKFLQTFVLNGNEREISSMMDVLRKQDPNVASGLADTLMAHIKRVVTGGVSEENAAFSEAQMRQFVNNPNMAARLTKVLGPERMAQLRQLHAVAEDTILAPIAARVNRSNTAAQGANIVNAEAKGGALNEILNLGKAIPGSKVLYDITDAQAKAEKARLGDLVNEAVGAAPSKRAEIRLGDLVSPGARAGVAVTEERNRRAVQR